MKNTNKNIILLLILFMPFWGVAQISENMHLNNSLENEINNHNYDDIKKNAVYFELFGNGIYYSIGFDRTLLHVSNSGFSIAHGFSYLLKNNNLFLSPQINYFYGEKHRFEIGLGLTYCILQKDETEYIFYRLGYRYQKQEGGVFYKIALTPFTVLEAAPGWNLPSIFPFMGFTIGWTF